jgi:dTDP-4-dehydrorhamnose reductase
MEGVRLTMALELWGGHEMTLNRVGSRYFDQTTRSGHHDRFADLVLFAELGITALRYPILWERTAPLEHEAPDFNWADQRLDRIRELGMKPIVGLLHHGSGPAYTDLRNDKFAAAFAAFARAVAERYPWIENWNPINEPLTTARFSCFYGLWYPHERTEKACWHALLTQIDAIRLAMREIRRIIPNARLIQTEDLGFCHATAALSAAAEFENERRWLTWDLLFGAVVPGHPLWERLVKHGYEKRLELIAAAPCPPDVIGINHYLTSERFIDHRVELYPGMHSAAEGPFVNLEAVRVLKQAPIGIVTLLEQAWRRYATTLAITECHNGCTRDEQIRWILETWKSAEWLRQRGIPVEAVTAWSLLGAFDWNHLVTVERGDYEPGAFDIRSGVPRATAVAHLLRNLSARSEPTLIGLSSPGWWRRDERLFYPAPAELAASPRKMQPPVRNRVERPLLITGKTGTLGQALARACTRRGLPHVLTSREILPLENPTAARAALEQYRPSAVLNAAGSVAIDDAELNPERCMSANVNGPETLAGLCREHDIPFVTFSSDQVFDGSKGASYVESDPQNPVNMYGRSKVEAERRVLAVGGRSLIVRTAAFFSPDDTYNFAVGALRSIRARERLLAADDQFVSPTYVPDLVDSVLDLLIDGETGIWHLANRGGVSWAMFAELLAERAQMDCQYIVPVPGSALGCRAPRPSDVTLASTRSSMLASLESAIDRFIHACVHGPTRILEAAA